MVQNVDNVLDYDIKCIEFQSDIVEKLKIGCVLCPFNKQDMILIRNYEKYKLQWIKKLQKHLIFEIPTKFIWYVLSTRQYYSFRKKG